MKKNLFLICLIISLGFLFGNFQQVMAVDISVTSPAAGNQWKQGSTHNITWNYTGNVDISLYKDNGFDRDIVKNVPSNSYSWTIPSALPVGNNYQIAIQSVNNFWDSGKSGLFSITGTPLPSGVPHIDNLFPVSGPSNTLITITGSNFNPDQYSNFIWLEGWHYPDEASASQLKFRAPYSSAGSYTIYVESMTQSGRTRTDNSKTFTITESCPYSSTGVCECLPITLVEGGCTANPGKCSPECTGGFAGKACYSNVDCTPAGQCNSPNRCSSTGQPCSALGTGWSRVGGNCPIGGTCCAPPSNAPSGTNSSGQSGTIQNPLNYKDLQSLINAIINFLIRLSIPVAAVMFVIAGAMFVTSAGDPERVKTAKKTMIYTAVGFSVILLASGLIKVLQSVLGSP